MNTCTKCNETKPNAEFGKDKRYANGLKTWCKQCQRIYSKEYYKTKPRSPEQKARNTLARKNHNLKVNYGITLDEYNEMLEFQDNKCAICGKEETTKIFGKIINLSVDHNHSLPKEHPEYVRSLLCSKCNHIIGNCNEDVEILRRCIDYLGDN